MSQIATHDLDKNLEALRAVRDPAVNLQGTVLILVILTSDIVESRTKTEA